MNKIHKNRVISLPILLSAALLGASCAIPVQAEPLIFNATPPANDLKGTLGAQVLFAQSQIIPARPREGDHQPHLIGLRKCLVLVRPLNPDDVTPMQLIAHDAQGRPLGSLNLNPPKLLPKTAYFVDGAPEGTIDFTPQPGSTGKISRVDDLNKLSDKAGAFLLVTLQRHAVVEIDTADGRWVRDIHLPDGKGLDGKIVRARSEAGYQSTIFYSGRQAALTRGQSAQFKCVNGLWFLDGELDNNAIIYSANTWSGVLPAQWIAPGLTLQLRQGNLAGDLTGVKVGAPTQLLIHTIDVGMLTTPRGAFVFAKDPEAQREYFQTVPVSRLTVSQYAPLTLTEVMLPSGNLLKDFDESEGGWHTGIMRQSIGKELISHGIDNANYGINSTSGQGERSHPYVVAQLTAHNNRGKYANGIRVHGGSGGGGIITLDHSLGNEFSHEVGHNYGLGHYVDGFKGSVHRSAGEINSTWGWDADKNRLIPNFAPTRSGKETCLDKECQPPFDGRSFGLDAMAGGAPLSGFNRFTFYTPNSAAIIQRFLENKAVFDDASPTGFSKWNPDTARMEPYTHRIGISREITAPVKDLGTAALAAMLAKYDVVHIALADGNWTRDIRIPAASADNKGRAITIDHTAAYSSTIFINGKQKTVSRGFKESYTSDGARWNEGPDPARSVERKPILFGVPVVTLVGYYDPEGRLPSYIYPALHGAYGYCYADDAASLKDTDCQLQVETLNGVLRFRLESYRIDGRCMNKFHINIPEASQPRSVAIVCDGRVLDKKPVAPAAEKPGITVNGE